MKKILLGMIISSIILVFCFVFVLENIHVWIERTYHFSWCNGVDEALQAKYGRPVRNVFYVGYKIFQYPIKELTLIENMNEEEFTSYNEKQR